MGDVYARCETGRSRSESYWQLFSRKYPDDGVARYHRDYRHAVNTVALLILTRRTARVSTLR